MKNYKVIGLECGLGVPLYPFKENLVGNIETRGIFHTPKNEQWESNFPGVPLWKVYDPKNLKQQKEVLKSADILISSPDCGAGSILRLSRSKELGDHKKNHSLAIFFKGLKRVKPKIFLFENLQALFKSFPEKEFKSACGDYHLIIHHDSVAKWGNSQRGRKRLVIIGIRRDLKYKKIRKYFKLPSTDTPLKTSGELIRDLYSGKKPFGKEIPELGHVREDMTKTINVYGGKWMTPQEMKDEWHDRLVLKSRWYIDPSENRKMKTAPGVYRNIATSLPATARKANRQFNHFGLMMSPRELARIMGVPDDFKIHVDMSNKQYWINKGRTIITKGMVYEVPLWFKNQLDKCSKLLG